MTRTKLQNVAISSCSKLCVILIALICSDSAQYLNSINILGAFHCTCCSFLVVCADCRELTGISLEQWYKGFGFYFPFLLHLAKNKIK